MSAVATVAYGAFLIGPPLIGGLGDSFGILAALWVVVGVIILAFFAAPRQNLPRTRPSTLKAHAARHCYLFC